MARFWYAYNGVQDPFNVSSYKKITPPNAPLCTSGGSLCAIYATGLNGVSTPNNPLSTNLQQYIALALTGGHVPEPRAPGAKRYVYLRD